MKMLDELGDKLKQLEAVEAKRVIPKGKFILARLDGRAFHVFTRGLQRPFDEGFSLAMVHTTTKLLEEFHPILGYTQSDEISLVWYIPEDAPGEYPFRGRVQKLSSLLAAHATAVFNQLIPKLMKSKIGELPIFDCRVWGVDELEDVLNTFAWREHDARKNAISMMASTYISHKKLQGVSSKQRIEMLAGLGHDFEAMPDRFKYGTYLARGVELRKLAPDELMKIPQKHREDMKSTLVARSLTKHLYGSIFDPQIKTYIDQRMERFVAHDLSSGSR